MKRHIFQLRTRPTLGAVLLFGGLVLAGCKKPDSDLGLDILDPADALGTNEVDTTSILAWTIVPEPSRTSGLSRNVLGTYLDPDFGLVNTGIVTQLRLSSNNVGDTTSLSALVCDSIVLSLAYDLTTFGYGNTDAQSFRVFRLNEDLRTDTSYLSDHVPGIFLEDLVAAGRPNFSIQPSTPLSIGGESLSPQLRIPLKTSVGAEILSKWGSSAFLGSNEVFLTWFKGLMILPSQEATVPFQQAALYFNLLGADSKVRLYYRNTALLDTATFDFVINTSCVRYSLSRFDHSRATEPGLPFALLNQTAGQQEVYVEALGGARTELRFPNILNYATNEAGSVAKAELVIPVDENHYPLYAPPAQLFVFRKDDDGKDVALPDQLSGTSQIGGLYDPEDHEYRFVITRWIQGVLNGEYPNTGLGVLPGSNGVSVNRAILFGPEHPVSPMKLRLTFTTY